MAPKVKTIKELAKEELYRQIEAARVRGEGYKTLTARELHDDVEAHFPPEYSRNQMPSVSNAMQEVRSELPADMVTVDYSPNKGQGGALKMTFKTASPQNAEDVLVFTCQKLEQFKKYGGTGWWKCDPKRVGKARRIILYHNAHDPRQPGNEAQHGKPFLVATIRDVLRADDGRYLMRFERFAEIEGGPRDWSGRNPVQYGNLGEVDLQYVDGEDVGESDDTGSWEEMGEVAFQEAQEARRIWDIETGSVEPEPVALQKRTAGEVVADYRAKISEELGVPPENIRISIDL